MQTIIDHIAPGLNEVLKVVALDEPGPGGANHCYTIYADESKVTLADAVTVHQTIKFQKGPIKEAGVTGVSNEAVLAVLIHRMRGFQAGQFACEENAAALHNLEMALYHLQSRTREREARGVEGTNQK